LDLADPFTCWCSVRVRSASELFLTSRSRFVPCPNLISSHVWTTLLKFVLS
jgi:hypothetical protein